MRFHPIALAVLLVPSGLKAASLDVTAAYRMRALSYENLNLDDRVPNDHSFISNDARLGVAVRKIFLENRGGEETTMDVGILFHALGIAGSTVPLQTPLDRPASNYPNADMTPFLENAYVRVHQFYGKPIEATFGRQTFRLGSGLLLDDDGAGLTGASFKTKLPWWDIGLAGFLFHDKGPQSNAPNSIDFYGLTVDMPTEGTWQLNQLFERDRSPQTVFGCSFTDPTTGLPAPCQVSKAVRSFTSARYQISYGPMVFDGEAAIQKGVATPTGAVPAPHHITYNGNAQVVKAKWKQKLFRMGEGIARISVAHGSGDKPGTKTTDEAFFPSHGHRFDGLERSGYGDFFAATPYDAFGGNYSSSTLSGLAPGASGISVASLGFTPPAYKGIVLDVDYFLYQADRVVRGSRTLGSEWDFRLRYQVLDSFTLSASYALFKTGEATNLLKNTARKATFEVSGRF